MKNKIIALGTKAGYKAFQYEDIKNNWFFINIDGIGQCSTTLNKIEFFFLNRIVKRLLSDTNKSK